MDKIEKTSEELKLTKILKNESLLSFKLKINNQILIFGQIKSVKHNNFDLR
jgi:hypothetical protein